MGLGTNLAILRKPGYQLQKLLPAVSRENVITNSTSKSDATQKVPIFNWIRLVANFQLLTGLLTFLLSAVSCGTLSRITLPSLLGVRPTSDLLMAFSIAGKLQKRTE